MSIAVLDFGGQYAHLLAQCIRKLGVYSEIVSPTISTDAAKKYAGLIFSGGPHSVIAPDAPEFNDELFNLGVPILGICYGHQLICKYFGSQILSLNTTEYGNAELHITKSINQILSGIHRTSTVWMSHGDSVKYLSPHLRTIAKTVECPVAVIEHCFRRIYGVQFHPEVTHSECGQQVLQNFLNVCGCSGSWSIKDYLQTITDKIREQCGTDDQRSSSGGVGTPPRNVFMLLSGGVDSTVAFTLLNRALCGSEQTTEPGQYCSDRVYGLHIDNGFMRQNESQQVEQALQKIGITNFKVVDASSDFYTALREHRYLRVLKTPVTDPQTKRKIIGDLFIDVQQREVTTFDGDTTWLLGQGTIYPDTIESGGTQHSHTIKTHHNRVDRIQEMIQQGLVIEPLADLYKDEVRELGELFGLPHNLLWRHPFPGPGLAIRLLCADKKRTSTQIDDLTVLPVNSVGVQGDQRSYASPAVIFGGDDALQLDWTQLATKSTAITNKHVGKINRVVYNLAGPQVRRVPGEKWQTTPAYLSDDRIQTLQRVDTLVTAFLRGHNLYDQVWQCPVVMIPCSPIAGKESIVLRPVNSTEAMTANFARLPMNLMQELAQQILGATPSVTNVLYDITNKPPGTIEWE